VDYLLQHGVLNDTFVSATNHESLVHFMHESILHVYYILLQASYTKKNKKENKTTPTQPRTNSTVCKLGLSSTDLS